MKSVLSSQMDRMCCCAFMQMATAIGLGMLFIVINQTYEFLGEASVWIVISVGVMPAISLPELLSMTPCCQARAAAGGCLVPLSSCLVCPPIPRYLLARRETDSVTAGCVSESMQGGSLGMQIEQ